MARRFDAVLFDMDGVLYRGPRRLPGAVDLLRFLDHSGIRYAMVTNNSTRSPRQYTRLLASMGMRVPATHIVTTSVATALHLRSTLRPGARVFVIGEPALRGAVAAAGFTLAAERVSAVVAGLDRRLTYKKLMLATQALLTGAAFVATNPDPLLPTAHGFAPGAGAVVAALRYTSGRAPTVIGKPRPFMLREALRRLGTTAARSAMVGDQVSTDIAAGKAAGTFTIFVESGISESGRVAATGPRPDLTVRNLPELQNWLARRS